MHLHIECPTPISTELWLQMLARCPGLRRGFRTVAASNEAPVPGSELASAVSTGEVFLEKQGWLPAFRWVGGVIQFRNDFDLSDSRHPVRVAASMLACLLDGEICSDDGRLYRW